MRYLTPKELDALSWRDLKLYLLRWSYAEDAARWENEHDDRRVFVNIYNMLIEAIESLPPEPHVIVCVAMNRTIAEKKEVLNKIKKVFADR